MTDRAEAKRRHPSASWHPDHDRLRRSLAEQLGADGHPWPVFAATLMGVRGLLGMDRAEFAMAIGINEAKLGAIEDGRAGPAVLRL